MRIKNVVFQYFMLSFVLFFFSLLFMRGVGESHLLISVLLSFFVFLFLIPH